MTGGRHRAVRDAYLMFVAGHGNQYVVFNPSYAVTEYSANELRRVLKAADLVVINDAELKYILDSLKLRQTARLTALIRGSLIVTHGRRGHTIFRRGETNRLRISGVETRNPIGAGDAFLAGVIRELVAGKNLEAAVTLGGELAARKVKSSSTRIMLR